MTKLYPLLPVLLLAAACSKDNPNYCAGAVDNNCATVDAGGSNSGDGGPTACSTSNECLTADPDLPVCDNNVCFECSDTEIGVCAGTTPVCMLNHCEACTMNTQCTSGACMPDGSCASASALIFASPAGTSTTCNSDTDACSLANALAVVDTTRNIIVLATGTYQTSGPLVLTESVTILGRGATLERSGSSGPVIDIATTSTTTKVYYATITNGDASNGDGVRCAGATLELRGVTLTSNDRFGVSSDDCDLTVDQSVVYSNTAGGIRVIGTAARFVITNNFIYANGNNTTSGFGGVSLDVTSPPSTSRFQFNSIVKNSSMTTGRGGAYCNGVSAPNNILAGNLAPSPTLDAQNAGTCDVTGSIVQADLANLAFVNATTVPYDLHIDSTSTAKDAAVTSPITYDFDGDQRPGNDDADVGADEYK